MRIAAKKPYRFLASYGLSCVLFLLLLLLTYLGTMYQTQHGLYEAQQRYFSSFFVVHMAFGALPVPLPGAYLLLIILFVNLLLGGIVQARKGWSKLGVLTAHAGILLLLLGGFITQEFSINGYLQLYEGEQSGSFECYQDWEMVIAEETGENSSVTEYILHEAALQRAWSSKGSVFALPGAPLEIHVAQYSKNSAPSPVTHATPGAPVVDGYALSRLAANNAERNIPGAYVTLREPGAGDGPRGIAWGGARGPLALEAGGRKFSIDLRRRRWQLPFEVKLNEFTRELHPGTQIPSEFRSDITKSSQGITTDAAISMNQPLRHHGYTFYQSSWGPPDAPPGTPLFTVLAVSRNPADKFPLYACIIITLGLVAHFTHRLIGYLRRQAAMAARAALILVAALSAGGTAAAAPADYVEWDKDTLRLLATLPVLDEGRLKPLDTVANVRLLKFNGKRTTVAPDTGRRVRAIEWLADCVFFPDRARQYKVFCIDNSEVAVALGLPVQARRARYSYEDLAPARERLLNLAREFSDLPRQQRNVMQAQTINLAHNVLEFEYLCDYGLFARSPAVVPEDSPVAGLFPGEPAPALSVVLANAPAVAQLVLQMPDMEPADSRGLHEYIGRLERNVQAAFALRLFPPPLQEHEWLTPALLTDLAFDRDAPPLDDQLEMLAAFERAVSSSHDRSKLAGAIGELHRVVTAQANARGEYGKIEIEVLLHALKPFHYSLVLFVLGFLLVTVSWLLPLNRYAYRFAFVFAFCPTILLIIGITMRSIIRGRPPVTTLYETILFTTLTAVVVGLFAEYVNRRRIMLSLGVLLGALGLFLANKYEVREGADTMPSMVAVLDANFWLATHVTTIVMGYGAGFLASAIGHLYVFGRTLRIKKSDPLVYRQMARMMYGILCFSMIFTMVGTVIGGIWANESWGRFWGWDPKENGALMIVLWQLALFHGRLGGYVKDFGIALASIFTGVIIAFAWFGVNLLGVGLHSYGFTSGAHTILISFYVVEALVMLLGAATWTLEEKPQNALKTMQTRRQ